jgi:hypothetical protein
MTCSRAPTLLLVGSIALTLSACASYGASASGSSYARASVGSYAAPDSSYASDSVASTCSPYYDDPGCIDGYPFGLYDYGGAWWPHDRSRQNDWHHGDYHANGRGMVYDLGHDSHGALSGSGLGRGGFAVSGFGHGGFGGGGIGHGGFGGGGGHGR